MVTITGTGISYTRTAPVNGSTISLAPNGPGSITITDVNSTFQPNDPITFNYGGGQITGSGTYLGTFTTSGNIYALFYSTQTLYDAVGLYQSVSGTFNSAAIACYLRGTLVDTPQGALPIEALAIGDEVVLATGGTAPIRWIGRRAYSPRFARSNPDVMPIRIAAGALAEGIPSRDLYVSPHHAMFLNGLLVEAVDLVNGTTIAQATPTGDIEYFHLELPQQGVILANGAPSESFVDDASRMLFHNADEYAALYPEAERGEVVFCAPRVAQGPALEVIRRRLAKMARRVGQAA